MLLALDSPYEELQLLGDFGLVEGIEFEGFRHQMSAGFYRSILTGARSGNRFFQLTYKVLPDSNNSPIQRDEATLEARATYLWEFFCRHKTGYVEIDRPFFVTDIATGKRFLVIFEDWIFQRELFRTRLYSSQLKVRYARVPGVNTLDDGSLGVFTSGQEI